MVQVSSDGQTVALRVTFGFMLSDDGGGSFRWVCEDALGYGGGSFDPSFALDASRRLFVGVADGLNRLSTDRCVNGRIAPLEGDFVADLDATRDGRTVVAITSSGSPTARNRVWRSTDSGENFVPMGAGLSNETLFETVEQAHSNPLRVYATAVRNTPRRVVFFSSDDGGATFRESSLDSFAVDDAFIAGISPVDPLVVFVRAPLRVERDAGSADAATPAATTVLLRSVDGGVSFVPIARSVGPMTGFAFSDNAATLWYGGTHADDGLRRSTDGGQTWSQLSRTQVTGMRFRNGTLWVAANWVTAGFALAKSRDNGVTLEPVLRTFCDVLTVPSCPAASEISGLCGARWPLYRSNSLACPAVQPSVDPPPDSTVQSDAQSGFDSSVSDPPPAAQGCRCVVAARSARSTAGPWIGAVCALVVLSNSRRYAHRRR